jgi:SprT protein
MTLSTNLKNQAQSRLEILFESAIITATLSEFSGVFNIPSLAYNQRGNIAGCALLQKNIIKLNPKLFIENPEYFLSHIIAHELAHILVYQLYGLRVKPHGLEWKKVMLEVFDLPPKVTHSLDTSNVKLKSFMYKCACQHIPLSVIRHNKVVKGKQNYICRKCGDQLSAVE